MSENKSDEVLKTMNLIYDTLEFNEVNMSIGMSACLNIVVRILANEGASAEGLESIRFSVDSCIKTINPESKVEEMHT